MTRNGIIFPKEWKKKKKGGRTYKTRRKSKKNELKIKLRMNFCKYISYHNNVNGLKSLIKRPRLAV